MHSGSHSRLSRALMVVALASCSLPAPAQFKAVAFEQPPTVLASEVIPAPWLRSPHYRVLDDVGVRENVYVFRVDSDVGTFETSSLTLLQIRLHEIATLAQAVNAFNKSNKKLGAKLRGVLSVRGDNFTDILTSPLRTAGSLAGQLTRNIGETIGVTKAEPDGSQGLAGAEPDERDPIAAAHRRTVASQLGLDVYSRNPKVQEFLRAVAQARESGRVSAGFTMVRTPANQRIEVAGGKIAAQVESVLRQLSASEVNGAVREELIGMGVALPAVQRLITNRVLSPRHRLVMAAHLDFLGTVPERGVLIERAAAAASEPEALAYQEMVRMAARFHESENRIHSFATVAGLPVAQTSERVVMLLPVDMIFWDERAAGIAKTLVDYASKKTRAVPLIVLLGTTSEAARQGFSRAGVDVRTHFLTP